MYLPAATAYRQVLKSNVIQHVVSLSPDTPLLVKQVWIFFCRLALWSKLCIMPGGKFRISSRTLIPKAQR